MKRLGLSFVVVLSIALVGCDGDGQGNTKAEFIRKADRICDRFVDKINPLIDEYNAEPDLQASAPIAEDIRELEDQQLRQLSRLDRPKGDAGVLQHWFDVLDQAADARREEIDLLADPEAPQDEYDRVLQRAESAEAEADGIARGYGMKTCSSLE